MTPQQIFKKEYSGSPNFITPKVVKYGWVENQKRAYELSTGEDFCHHHVYGVTVLSISNGVITREDEVSQCFVGHNAKKEALEFIGGLQDKALLNQE